MRLPQFGFESIVLAFDNDAAGREGLIRAVDHLSRAHAGPGVRVLEPRQLEDSKDPDAFVRERGLETFLGLVERADCGVAWRALEFTDGVSSGEDATSRRAALARAGNWLGTLPARLSLEQEDAIRRVADRCGYSSAAVERSFRARFWGRSQDRPGLSPSIER
jgi:DNA primase